MMIPPIAQVHLKPMAGVLQARGVILLAFDAVSVNRTPVENWEKGQ